MYGRGLRATVAFGLEVVAQCCKANAAQPIAVSRVFWGLCVGKEEILLVVSCQFKESEALRTFCTDAVDVYLSEMIIDSDDVEILLLIIYFLPSCD